MSLVYYVKPEECYKIQKKPKKQRNKPKKIPLAIANKYHSPPSLLISFKNQAILRFTGISLYLTSYTSLFQ